jgi:predicted nucleic acid-binding protein
MLVESDLFIAVIKERDRLKSAASEVLQSIETGKISNAYASVAVVQEVIFWLLRENRSADVLTTVDALFNIKNLEWIDLSKEICLNAAALMEEYQLSSFDAYHAATAISRDGKILSSDHAYDKIKSIERIDLSIK